jgi:hypothetical protein
MSNAEASAAVEGVGVSLRPPAARSARDLTLEHPAGGAIFDRTRDILRRSDVRGKRCQSHGTGGWVLAIHFWWLQKKGEM